MPGPLLAPAMMPHTFRKINAHPAVTLSIIALCFSVLALMPFAWRERAEEAIVDLQFRLRGERPLSDKIVLVYLGAEDLQALGGWPITRDYYGYLLHGLRRARAQAVGIDILFDRSDRHYPEFDTLLADFMRSSGNVCLPLAFAELTPADSAAGASHNLPPQLAAGRAALLPLPAFRANAAAMGFSNFTSAAVIRKTPLVLRQGDTLSYAFGFELARLYLGIAPDSVQTTSRAVRLAGAKSARREIPLDSQGRLRLNHFGDVGRVTALSFVDLLRRFSRAPDSLDFSGKIVLVAATAPGLPVLKATPLAEALPAALIHATIAENIIEQNFLREAPALLQVVMIALLVLAASWIGRSRHAATILALSLAVLAILALRAVILFRSAHLIVPVLLPALAYLTSVAFLSIRRRQAQQIQSGEVHRLLQQQIAAKETELAQAQARLQELRQQLQQETAASAQTRQLAEARRNAILALEKQLRDLQNYSIAAEPVRATPSPEIIHAADSPMARVLAAVAKVAAENLPVLIMGETGSGKELIAHAIHRAGPHPHAPFVAVNCSALPETLLESELFGHEKGSFTGAQARRRGRFELAKGGTIFLDEITETSPALQARLLRVLQDGTFERLGGEQTLHANVRVIAACNRDLPAEVASGRFRADLFYRLNGFPLTLPPLRERKQDIPLLAAHFLTRHGHHSVRGFSEAAMAGLQAYAWPGNVRELENLVRRAAILARSEGRDLIQASDLPKELAELPAEATAAVLYKPLEAQILEMLRRLRFSRSAISQTAKALGNRDRGTITEYFRGICFENLVQAGFEARAAAQAIAATTEVEVIGRVQAKIEKYLKNIPAGATPDPSSSLFRGLPQKYWPYLQQVMEQRSRFGKTPS